MTWKVRRDFKIITDELSRVSQQFHWWHRTFGDLRFVPQNLYIRKQVRRFWRSWRQLSKQASQRFRGPDSLYPVCYDSQLLPTPPSPPRGREKKNVTKMNFSSCNDHSPKWIINDWYIFVPYLRVWVFLFPRTSFFTGQHVGPMLQFQFKNMEWGDKITLSKDYGISKLILRCWCRGYATCLPSSRSNV